MLNCDQFHLRALFNELDSTLTALDTACGISSELRYIPQTEILPGLNDLHAKGFVPMSYHLITARGGNRLMLNGQCRYKKPAIYFK